MALKPPKPFKVKKPVYKPMKIKGFPGMGDYKPKVKKPVVKPMQYPKFDRNTVGGMAGQQAQQPDYGTLISGDWEVQGAEAAMGAGMARSRGDFQAQLRQALIDLGISDTSKLGNLGQYIDADTIKAAVENKYSATAKNAQQAVRQRDLNNAALAARGLESSGATTKMQQDVTAQQEANSYSMLRDFLSGGATGLASLAQQEEQYAQQLAAARASAAARAGEQYQMGSGAAGENGSLFAQTAQMPGMGVGWNQNYRKPVRLSRQQFMQKKPRGNYQNYARAWKRQHPYGF